MRVDVPGCNDSKAKAKYAREGDGGLVSYGRSA